MAKEDSYCPCGFSLKTVVVLFVGAAIIVMSAAGYSVKFLVAAENIAAYNPPLADDVSPYDYSKFVHDELNPWYAAANAPGGVCDKTSRFLMTKTLTLIVSFSYFI